MFRIIFIGLVVTYPLSAHLSVHYELPLAVWNLVVLALVQAMAGVVRHQPGKVIISVFIATALLSLVRLTSVDTVLSMLPVLISAWLLYLFGTSLMSSRTALITRVAELTEGDITPAVRSYTRWVTVTWTLVFAVLTIESVLLALYADELIWSLFTNFLNYIFLLSVFIIEYAIRKNHFPARAHASFVTFMRRLMGINWLRLSLGNR